MAEAQIGDDAMNDTFGKRILKGAAEGFSFAVVGAAVLHFLEWIGTLDRLKDWLCR